MSNPKRDWMKAVDKHIPPNDVLDAATELRSDYWFAAICDWAESIVRRELAGEVEKWLDRLYDGSLYSTGYSDALRHVIALLSPQNEKDQ